MDVSQRAFFVSSSVLETIAVIYLIAFLVSFDSAISMLKAGADPVAFDSLRSAWQWIGIAGFSHLAAALLRLLRDWQNRGSDPAV